MVTAASFCLGDVMHHRLIPRENRFKYRIFYCCLPLHDLSATAMPLNRWGRLSFYEKDHGDRKGGDLLQWLQSTMGAEYNRLGIANVMLVAMPRVCGYVFNPVSFWMCLDAEQRLRAVLCEVNNTFGETHTYICRHQDGQVIGDEDWLEAEKLFHVSPFLERVGHYRFQFHFSEQQFKVNIDYYNAQGDRQLLTLLQGRRIPLTENSCRQVFWQYPLVTAKAVALIHWQAVKLLGKRIRFISKPNQMVERVSWVRRLSNRD